MQFHYDPAMQCQKKQLAIFRPNSVFDKKFFSDKLILQLHFQWKAINIPLKSNNLPKTSNQFLNLSSGSYSKFVQKKRICSVKYLICGTLCFLTPCSFARAMLLLSTCKYYQVRCTHYISLIGQQMLPCSKCQLGS